MLRSLLPLRGGRQRLCCSALRAFSASGAAPEASNSLRSVIQDHDLLRTTPFIGGSWSLSTRDSYQVVNPANGSKIATLGKAGAAETVEAIACAATAGLSWGRTTATARAALLQAWHTEITKHADDLATLVTMESGKPLAEARNEVSAGAASVQWFAEESKRAVGRMLQPTSHGQQQMTIKQPIGVIAAITPWNFPFSMITRKVAPALAAGCTVVLKPAEETPLTANALAVLGQRAGLMDGVLNVLSGDAPAIGKAMMDSSMVRKVSFTGSSAVGKLLLGQAAGSVKRVSMELGGNAPFIVFADADLEAAADAAIASSLRNAGQTCICASRILVQDAVHDTFAELVSARMRAVRLGSGLQSSTTMGPCINPARLQRAQDHVDDAVALGATVAVGGSPPKDLEAGYFFQPTMLTNATSAMRVFREETFAPVVALFKFSSESEAIQLANNTEYGLAAYFFTKDLARAWRVAEELEYGMVGINQVAIVSETAPFGGVKQSGIGRENGPTGIDEFLEEKYICMGLNYT